MIVLKRIGSDRIHIVMLSILMFCPTVASGQTGLETIYKTCRTYLSIAKGRITVHSISCPLPFQPPEREYSVSLDSMALLQHLFRIAA